MQWRRVHRPLRGAKVIMVAGMSAIIAAVVLIYVSLLGSSDTAFAIAMYTAVGGIVLGMWAWRRWSYGVFVGAGGIRITFVSGTMLFALNDIVRVDVRRTRRAGSASSLWIVMTDGTAVESPVVRGRARIGQYAVDRPARLHLTEPAFDAVIIELEAELRRRLGIGYLTLHPG